METICLNCRYSLTIRTCPVPEAQASGKRSIRTRRQLKYVIPIKMAARASSALRILRNFDWGRMAPGANCPGPVTPIQPPFGGEGEHGPVEGRFATEEESRFGAIAFVRMAPDAHGRRHH